MARSEMQHVFGPVPSRRLGMSLGIDPIPLKTCNYSCVYCQLGRSRRLADRRRPYFSVSDIAAEVASELDRLGDGAVDWVTFVGAGETTLSSRLGSLIRFVKSITDVPVAVITNGSLLYMPSVRADLAAADAVLPSLDAGDEDLYRRINRPRRQLSFERLVDGLVDLRQSFDGKLWVEVMLVRGMNDSADALHGIKAVLERVKPDEIHLGVPTRPPAEPWVEPPLLEADVEWAASIFEGVAPVLRPVSSSVEPTFDGNLSDALLNILRRHPMQQVEIEGLALHGVRHQVEEALEALFHSGRIQAVERFGKRYWCSSGLDFPTEETLDEAGRTSRLSFSRNRASCADMASYKRA